MTDTFSFPRFGKLLATDLTANVKKYSLWLGLIVGIISALVVIAIMSNTNAITNKEYFYYSVSFSDPVAAFMIFIFYFGLFITTAIAASLTMHNFAEKGSRINAMMLPATQLEKFLSRWLIFVPGFLAIYLLSFQVIDWVRVVAEMAIFGSDANIKSINVITLLLPDIEGPVVIWGLMIVQSVFLLGSTIWPKNSMVKTVCAIGIISLALIIFNILCIQMLLDTGSSYSLNLTDAQEVLLAWATVGFLTLANYIIAYYRYKEIELIQRW